ncbi:hypothetical protein FI667_g6162, partial [Globisporangium splendens]
MAPPSSNAPRRALAASLMQAQTTGISTIIQERIHSTTVGLEATSKFLQQLVSELEDAVAEYVAPAAAYHIEHQEEVELGTLITASSLTVALMASTRALEAFGEHIEGDDVVAQLRWLMTELLASSELNEVSVQKINYLLRPTCEHISVASQTHPAAERMIYGELYANESKTEKDARVADSAQQELVSTVAVLVEVKLPASTANVYTLLPVPSFVEEIEVSEASDSLQPDEEDAVGASEGASQLLESLSSEDISQCAITLCSWLNLPARRPSAVLVLPILCHALYTCHQSCTAVESVVDALVACLHGLELKKLLDFEFMSGLVESLRDIALRVPSLPPRSIASIYNELRFVMPRLESAIKSPELEKNELRAIKASCSKIRQALVESFLAWMYNAGAENFAVHQEDFLTATSTKLADPRIYGDAVHVLRTGKKPDADDEVRELVGHCADLLTRALAQLDRYTKVTANRIVSAVTRIASASGKFVGPHADDLALPLLVSIVDGSAKGKSLRLRQEAVACILLGAAQDLDFQVHATPPFASLIALSLTPLLFGFWFLQFADHLWIHQYLEVLLETADSGNAHTLLILAGLANEPRLLPQVVDVCVTKGPTIGQAFHESLSRWPLYEEDIEAVVLTLEILKALLSADALRALLDAATLASTVKALAENAAGEELDAVAVACRELLASAFFEK